MHPAIWRSFLALALGLPAMAAAENPDEAALRELNRDYVRAFLSSDVARYRELLADDFRAVLSDGRQIDKAEFLLQAAQPPGVTGYRLGDIVVRQYGDTALVNARLDYKRRGGSEIHTRYVDVYVRSGGRWQLVSAQFTRISAF